MSGVSEDAPKHGRSGARIEQAVIHLEQALANGFLLAILVLVIAQVVSRYGFARPPVWTEEFARYAMVWLTFVGGGLLAARQRHITVHAINRVLGTRALLVLQVLVNLAISGVCGVLLVASYGYLERVSAQRSAAAGLPMSWVYGAVAVGFGLVLIHGAVSIVRDIRLWRMGELEAAVEATEPGTGEALT